jgi:hypothetical protein
MTVGKIILALVLGLLAFRLVTLALGMVIFGGGYAPVIGLLLMAGALLAGIAVAARRQRREPH